MTKLFAITTSLLILFQSFNLHINDVLELDELIGHYQFHSQEYGDSFLVFLSKHYGKLKAEHHENHQEERQEHEKLPFQHHCLSFSLLVFIPGKTTEYQSRIEVTVNEKSNFHYFDTYTSLWSDGPFQPPRHT